MYAIPDTSENVTWTSERVYSSQGGQLLELQILRAVPTVATDASPLNRYFDYDRKAEGSYGLGVALNDAVDVIAESFFSSVPSELCAMPEIL